MMNLTESIALITAIAAGQPATAEQMDMFRQWFYHEATAEERETLTRAHEAALLSRDAPPEYDPATAANIFSRLQAYYEGEMQAVKEHEQERAPLRKVAGRRYWWAAAAILVLLGSATLWISRQAEKTPVPLAKGALAPGGNKAVLTLANGRQVILDSKTSGTVATTGGVSVVQLDSGLIAYQGEGTGVQYHTLTTPRGGQFQLTLPDGSHVWLNSASSLRFPTAFSGGERTVELTGEGYFEIVKNAEKPFSVDARGTKVLVLGTGFNIMAYEDEDAIRTTLVNGSVKIKAAGAETLLSPGMQASMGKGGTAFTVSRPDLSEVLAWKNGQFSFGRTNIKSIMRQVARWYDVNVYYEGNVDWIEFQGILSRKATAKQLLETIEETGEVHFRIEGNNIHVVPGPKK